MFESCCFKTSVGASIVLQTIKHLFSTVGSSLLPGASFRRWVLSSPRLAPAPAMPDLFPLLSHQQACFLSRSQANSSIFRK